MTIFDVFRRDRVAELVEIELKKAENVVINAKNKQIGVLTRIINDHVDHINILLDQLKKHKGFKIEDRVVDMVEKVADEFLFKNKKGSDVKKISTADFVQMPDQVEDPQSLETGRQYTDEEIQHKLSTIPKRSLNKLIARGHDEFVQNVKDQVSDISDESAERSYEIALQI